MPVGRRNPRAREEWFDEVTGMAVRGPAAGASRTGRMVTRLAPKKGEKLRSVEVDGDFVNKSDASYGIDADEVPDLRLRAGRESKLEEATAKKRPRYKQTFKTGRDAAREFFGNNSDFFTEAAASDPSDPVSDFFDALEVRSRGGKWRSFNETAKGRAILEKMKGQPVEAIMDALTYMFGQASSRRWDAVSWSMVDGMAEALREAWERENESGSYNAGTFQSGGTLSWYPPAAGHGGDLPDFEAMDPDDAERAAAGINADALAEDLARLRGAYQSARPILDDSERKVARRRIRHLRILVNDPSKIARTMLCQPEGFSRVCGYPVLHAEIGRLEAMAGARTQAEIGNPPGGSTMRSGTKGKRRNPVGTAIEVRDAIQLWLRKNDMAYGVNFVTPSRWAKLRHDSRAKPGEGPSYKDVGFMIVGEGTTFLPYLEGREFSYDGPFSKMLEKMGWRWESYSTWAITVFPEWETVRLEVHEGDDYDYDTQEWVPRKESSMYRFRRTGTKPASSLKGKAGAKKKAKKKAKKNASVSGRIPRAGERVRFWESDRLTGNRRQVEAVVVSREGNILHVRLGDGSHAATPVRKMEILKKKAKKNPMPGFTNDEWEYIESWAQDGIWNAEEGQDDESRAYWSRLHAKAEARDLSAEELLDIAEVYGAFHDEGSVGMATYRKALKFCADSGLTLEQPDGFYPDGTPMANPVGYPHGLSGETFKGVLLPPGISVAWSRVNQAYFVMWHDSVLRVIGDDGEVKEYLRELGSGAAADLQPNPVTWQTQGKTSWSGSRIASLPDPDTGEPLLRKGTFVIDAYDKEPVLYFTTYLASEEGSRGQLVSGMRLFIQDLGTGSVPDLKKMAKGLTVEENPAVPMGDGRFFYMTHRQLSDYLASEFRRKAKAKKRADRAAKRADKAAKRKKKSEDKPTKKSRIASFLRI